MQPGTRKFLRFLQSWAINTLAVLIAAMILHGHIRYGNSGDLIIASLLLGILNAFVRPILMLLALPLLIFTLGLFTLVINALAALFRRRADGPLLSSGQLRICFSGRDHYQRRVHRAECPDRQCPGHRPAPAAEKSTRWRWTRD